MDLSKNVRQKHLSKFIVEKCRESRALVGVVKAGRALLSGGARVELHRRVEGC